MFKVVLSELFSIALGATEWPEMGLFKRFQKRWPDINMANFQLTGDELFNGVTDGLQQEMTILRGLIKSQTPLEDYGELLQLCHVFLGGSSDGEPCFRAPSAMHNLLAEDLPFQGPDEGSYEDQEIMGVTVFYFLMDKRGFSGVIWPTLILESSN